MINHRTYHLSQLSRLFWLPALCLWLVAAPLQAGSTLAPGYESDRLLLATEAALTQNQFSAARQYLDQAQALGVQLPADFHYYQARVREHEGQDQKAQQSYEAYVNQSGKQGRFYREALEAITRLKARQRDPDRGSQQMVWQDPQHQNLSSDAYTARLQQLYRSNSAEQALLRHVNSLLQFYALYDAPSASWQRYELALEDRAIQTRLRQEDEHGAESRLKLDTLPVFGINPYLNSGCGKEATYEPTCWIRHPQTGQPWLLVRPDPNGIAEIGRALSELIKRLQK